MSIWILENQEILNIRIYHLSTSLFYVGKGKTDRFLKHLTENKKYKGYEIIKELKR